MRLEGPIVRLPIGFQKRCVKRGDFVGDRTVRPEQTRSPRLRAITDILEDQLESAKSGGYAAKLGDCEKRAIMLDLGDISPLSPRKIQPLEHVFVSHTHIDHFIGFDRLLRVLVGREKTIRLYGPNGFIEQVQHKLFAYQWNLIDRFMFDLVFIVTELDAAFAARTARLRSRMRLRSRRPMMAASATGVLYSEPTFRVTTAVLEHRTPCLGFAIQEAAHVNVWKNRLSELGLPVGPWLRELKRAVVKNREDNYPIHVGLRSKTSNEPTMLLGERRRLYQKEGRDPRPAEIASRMGIPVARVEQVLSMVQEPTSFDAPVGEDDDATLGDLIKAPEAIDPHAAAEAGALQKVVGEALAGLTPREQRILRMRFGIGEASDHTLEEIGKEFGVTRERIRQIEAKALEKLRDPALAHKLATFVEN